MVDHGVDVGVEQRVGGEGRGLDVAARHGLHLVGAGDVHHGDLHAAGGLVGLLHGEVLGELREAVAPLHATLEGGGHGLRRYAGGEVGGGGAAHDAVAHLGAHDGDEQHDDERHGGAGDDGAHVGTGGVLAGEGVDLEAHTLATAAAMLLLGGGGVGVAGLVDRGEQGLDLVVGQPLAPLLTRHRVSHPVVPSMIGPVHDQPIVGNRAHGACAGRSIPATPIGRGGERGGHECRRPNTFWEREARGVPPSLMPRMAGACAAAMRAKSTVAQPSMVHALT